MTITEKNEILKDVAEIMDDCDYITRRVQILKTTAKAVADALALADVGKEKSK